LFADEKLYETRIVFFHSLIETITAVNGLDLLKHAEDDTEQLSILTTRDESYLRNAEKILAELRHGNSESKKAVVEIDARAVFCFKFKGGKELTLVVSGTLDNAWTDAGLRPLSVPELREILRILPFSMYPYFDFLAEALHPR